MMNRQRILRSSIGFLCIWHEILRFCFQSQENFEEVDTRSLAVGCVANPQTQNKCLMEFFQPANLG